jgi:hypothetical protein
MVVRYTSLDVFEASSIVFPSSPDTRGAISLLHLTARIWGAQESTNAR